MIDDNIVWPVEVFDLWDSATCGRFPDPRALGLYVESWASSYDSPSDELCLRDAEGRVLLGVIDSLVVMHLQLSGGDQK